MRATRKCNVLGILIDAVDYRAVLDVIFAAAREGRATLVSALAVHGLMTGVLDAEQKFRLNHFDLLVPDGQPIRWVLNLLHHAKLSDRVYGPTLTLKACARAEAEKVPVYFYGSTPEILSELRRNLNETFPGLIVAGLEPSKFRRLTAREKGEVAARIQTSGARLAFIGLGCPRQEAFAYEFRELLPMPVLAVGAAFPFLAKQLPQAPAWMQNAGMEWLFRLASEPGRLWRRYLYLNPAYLVLVALQALKIRSFSTTGKTPTGELLFG
jgi:N-acetylglucosaminyldiphosphoundecaprenol N-acetyl-beta-D-mannosaminyltransferase